MSDIDDEDYWEPYLEALKDWYRLCYNTVNEASESYAGMVQNINLWLAVEEVSNERLSYILEKPWKYKYLAVRLLWNQEVDAYLELMDNYLSSESASLLENFNPEGRDYGGEIVYTSWYTPYPELKVVRDVFEPSWLPSEDWKGRWSEPYAFELFYAESYKPPASAVANAKRGLKLRKEWGRGGLSPSEAKSHGIDSGVTRARKIASGTVSRHDVRRMSAFNRHRKNYRPEKKMPDGGPTAGTIAWLLWGGTSGVNWAKKKSAAMNAESISGDPWDEGSVADEVYKLFQKHGNINYWSYRQDDGNMLFEVILDPNQTESSDFAAEDYSETITMTLHFTDKPEEKYTFPRNDLIFFMYNNQTNNLNSFFKEQTGHFPMADGLMIEPHISYNEAVIEAERILDESNAESFEASGYQKQKQCAVCLDYEPYNKMMSCFVCGQNYCGSCEKYDSCAEYSSENWGGDPDGPLAKALAKARESSKQPRKPLQITRLPDPNQKTLKDFEAKSTHCQKCDQHSRHCECYCEWCKKDTPLYNNIRGEWVCNSCKQNWDEEEWRSEARAFPIEWEWEGNNEGLIYGIEYTDKNGYIDDVKWFSTASERDEKLARYNEKYSSSAEEWRSEEGICSWCGEAFDGTEVYDEWESIIVHLRCGESPEYKSQHRGAGSALVDVDSKQPLPYSWLRADWQDLPRNELGQWQRPVSEEVLQMLVDSDSMPTLSELLEMYGGDTPTNRWKLYKALMDIYISNDPTEDTIVDFSDNLEIETPEEYYQFILQEELDIPEDEDDTQTIEFWDRYSRYVASAYTAEEIEFMIAEAIESIDLFADEGDLREITALNAALKLQPFMEKYQAE